MAERSFHVFDGADGTNGTSEKWLFPYIPFFFSKCSFGLNRTMTLYPFFKSCLLPPTVWCTSSALSVMHTQILHGKAKLVGSAAVA